LLLEKQCICYNLSLKKTDNKARFTIIMSKPDFQFNLLIYRTELINFCQRFLVCMLLIINKHREKNCLLFLKTQSHKICQIYVFIHIVLNDKEENIFKCLNVRLKLYKKIFLI